MASVAETCRRFNSCYEFYFINFTSGGYVDSRNIHCMNITKKKETLDVSCNQSKPRSQLQNRNGPVFRLRVGFLSCFTGTLLLNFNTIVDGELWPWAFRNWNIFSAPYVGIGEFLIIYWVGVYDVIAERRKSRAAVYKVQFCRYST
jgi:hypothetical protein